MPLKSLLGPELPYLRRYARAVTGSQVMGDAAVRETLEALLEAPEEFDSAKPARTELYRIFHRLFSPATVAELADRDHERTSIPVRARQALLLVAVEGFSIDDTAAILDADRDAIEQDLEQARAAIADSVKSDILIIEDEAIIALHIQSIVKQVGHRVVGVARTRAEAVALAAREKPELVLADISLGDGSSGIDAVQDILSVADVPVIFVTAFPERLLTGERPEPTYLLTKPFEPLMLTATIAQALLVQRGKTATADAVA